MASTVRQHILEALVGLLVVLVAVWFIFFAWQRTGGGIRHRIEVKALFPAAAGVSVGTDVRIAGLTVGTVASQRLDPESYQAEVTMALDGDVRVPSDTSAAITSESLLGGTYIALVPGGSEAPLKDGDTIIDTQGSVDMMSLIGSVINGGSKDSAVDAASAGGGMGEPVGQ